MADLEHDASSGSYASELQETNAGTTVIDGNGSAHVSFSDSASTFSTTPAPQSSPQTGLMYQVKVLCSKCGIYFMDEETEARYLDVRFDDIRVSIAAAFIMGMLYIMMPMANFTSRVFHETPDNYYTLDKERSPWVGHPIGYIFLSGGVVNVIIAIVLMVCLRREVEIPTSVKELAAGIIYLMICFPAVSTRQATHDFFCDKEGGLLRYHATGNKATCDEFVEPYFFTTTALVFAVSGRAIFTTATLVFSTLAYFVGRVFLGGHKFLLPMEYILLVYAFFLIVLVVAMERVGRQQFLRIDEVRKNSEDAKKNRKLFNQIMMAMVPPSVLSRLIEGETVADGGTVTVLFADVAGFTKWCTYRSASSVVAALNDLYCLADSALHKDTFLDLVKVKTIGDAYWAMCGLPVPVENHATVCAKYAFWLSKEVEAKQHFTMRYGLHSGEVVAGIVGFRQLAYEPFGDVNHIAELVEINAPNGKVQITDKTYDFLVQDTTINFRTTRSAPLSYGGEAIVTHVLNTIRDRSNHGGLAFHNSISTRSSVSTISLQISDLEQGREFLLQAGTSGTFSQVSSGTFSASAGDTSQTFEIDAASLTQIWFAPRYPSPWSPFCEYLNIEVEEEFRNACSDVFVKASFITNVYLFAVCSTIYLITLIEERPHPPISHVLRFIGTVIPAIFMLFQNHLPVMAHFASLYISFIFFFSGICAMNASFASNELLYVSVIFSLGTMCRGAPIISWLWVVVINFLLISLPTAIVNEVLLEVRVHHLFHPISLLAPWIVATRRLEIGAREHFQSSKMARYSLKESRKELDALALMLKKCVPSFIIPRLQQWFSNNRRGYIAKDISSSTVLFVRMPHISSSEAVREPTQLLRLISTVAHAVDRSLDKYPTVLKIKTVGDITLIVAGIRPSFFGKAESSNYKNNPLSNVPHAIACAHAALNIAEVIRYNTDKMPHMGIHCGPLTCGVIGTERPIFDAFGDTVNVASRITSVTLSMVSQADGGSEGADSVLPLWTSTQFAQTYDANRHHLLHIASSERSDNPFSTNNARSTPLRHEPSKVENSVFPAGSQLGFGPVKQLVAKGKSSLISVQRAHLNPTGGEQGCASSVDAGDDTSESVAVVEVH